MCTLWCFGLGKVCLLDAQNVCCEIASYHRRDHLNRLLRPLALSEVILSHMREDDWEVPLECIEEQ